MIVAKTTGHHYRATEIWRRVTKGGESLGEIASEFAITEERATQLLSTGRALCESHSGHPHLDLALTRQEAVSGLQFLLSKYPADCECVNQENGAACSLCGLLNRLEKALIESASPV